MLLFAVLFTRLNRSSLRPTPRGHLPPHLPLVRISLLPILLSRPSSRSSADFRGSATDLPVSLLLLRFSLSHSPSHTLSLSLFFSLCLSLSLLLYSGMRACRPHQSVHSLQCDGGIDLKVHSCFHNAVSVPTLKRTLLCPPTPRAPLFFLFLSFCLDVLYGPPLPARCFASSLLSSPLLFSPLSFYLCLSLFHATRSLSTYLCVCVSRSPLTSLSSV